MSFFENTRECKSLSSSQSMALEWDKKVWFGFFFNKKFKVIYSTSSLLTKFDSSFMPVSSEPVEVMSVKFLDFDLLVPDFLKSEEVVPQNVLLSALLEKDVSDTPSDGWK